MMSRKFALIIANSEYQDTRLARLSKPSANVNELGAILRAPDLGGFAEVTILINENLTTVLRAMADFFAKKKPDDLLLLYFSGHGMLDDREHLYLAVKDTERDLLRGTAIPAVYITDEMDRGLSQHQVLILDCYYSRQLAPGTKAIPGPPVGTAAAFGGNGLGRVVLTATDSTQYAWEDDQVMGEAEDSVFTHYLIQGLKTGAADLDADGWITLDEVYDYVYAHVVNETPRQTPGKWSYQQQQEIVMARSPQPVGKMKAEFEAAHAQPPAAKRFSSKALWISLVTVVVLGGVGSWFFFLKPDQAGNGDLSEPTVVKKNDLSEPTAAARQDMLALKSAAQQAGAETWAKEPYQLALSEEQKGNQALAAGNYATAKQAYVEAGEEFRKSTEEAKRNAAMAEADLNRLKDIIATVKQEMRNEKLAAEQASGETVDRALFEKALREEQEGDQNFAIGTRMSLLAARDAYARARNDFKEARERGESVARLKRNAEDARKAMDEAMRRVPGSEQVRNGYPEYQKAQELDAEGEKQFQAERFDGAQDAFEQAKAFYLQAATGITTILKKKADDAKASMSQVKAKIDEKFHSENNYQQALNWEKAGNRAYSEKDFERAGEGYHTAQNLYLEVEKKQMSLVTFRQAIQNLADEFKAVLETRDIRGLQTLFKKSFTKEDENIWSDFFKSADNIKVTIDIKIPEPSANTTKVGFLAKMSYYNKANNREENKDLPSKWTLQEINGVWVIVSHR